MLLGVSDTSFRNDLSPELPGDALSEKLQTPPLPVTHVLLDYCWSHSRFAVLTVTSGEVEQWHTELTLVSTSETETLRFRNCKRHSALSAEMRPLTGRDLMVVRSMQ